MPKKYKYDNGFAKFDLGLTGGVYYPAKFYINDRSTDSYLIDFGHEDFFFTEDSYKTLAQLKK